MKQSLTILLWGVLAWLLTVLSFILSLLAIITASKDVTRGVGDFVGCAYAHNSILVFDLSTIEPIATAYLYDKLQAHNSSNKYWVNGWMRSSDSVNLYYNFLCGGRDCRYVNPASGATMKSMLYDYSSGDALYSSLNYEANIQYQAPHQPNPYNLGWQPYLDQYEDGSPPGDRELTQRILEDVNAPITKYWSDKGDILLGPPFVIGICGLAFCTLSFMILPAFLFRPRRRPLRSFRVLLSMGCVSLAAVLSTVSAGLVTSLIRHSIGSVDVFEGTGIPEAMIRTSFGRNFLAFSWIPAGAMWIVLVITVLVFVRNKKLVPQGSEEVEMQRKPFWAVART